MGCSRLHLHIYVYVVSSARDIVLRYCLYMILCPVGMHQIQRTVWIVVRGGRQRCGRCVCIRA